MSAGSLWRSGAPLLLASTSATRRMLLESAGLPVGDGDKRCSIEIRPEHMPAVAANHEGPTIEAAAAGAADKVLRAFDKQIGKRTDRKGH